MTSPLHQLPCVASIYLNAFRVHAQSPAVISEQGSLTYAELAKRSFQLARQLESLGLALGDGVCLLSGNRVEALLVTTACHLLGLRSTALHPLGSLADHLFTIEEIAAKAVIVDTQRFAARGREYANTRFESGLQLQVLTMDDADYGQNVMAQSAAQADTPVIRDIPSDAISKLGFTGGTTGKPKGVVHTQRVSLTTITQQNQVWDWPRPASALRFLAVTPISHAAGSIISSVFSQGGAVCLQDKFTPHSFAQTVKALGITASFLVPTQIYDLLDAGIAPAELASLQLVLYGAAPINVARIAQAVQTYGPIFGQVYGQAESPMTISYLSKYAHDLAQPQRLASAGTVIAGNTVALLNDDGQPVPTGEIGEICVRGPLVMAGYFKRPEETEKVFRGDWLHTGDLARFDEDGYLYLVDRAKDMVISGGFNVYPTEVENCLATHPAVSNAAVIGVPHARWGEAVVAIVVQKPGQQHDAAALAAELIALVHQDKGPVQAPKKVVFVDAIPVTNLGKMDKKAMRVTFAGLFD
jgi:fatty-acyl-CoA synthase